MVRADCPPTPRSPTEPCPPAARPTSREPALTRFLCGRRPGLEPSARAAGAPTPPQSQAPTRLLPRGLRPCPPPRPQCRPAAHAVTRPCLTSRLGGLPTRFLHELEGQAGCAIPRTAPDVRTLPASPAAPEPGWAGGQLPKMPHGGWAGRREGVEGQALCPGARRGASARCPQGGVQVAAGVDNYPNPQSRERPDPRPAARPCSWLGSLSFLYRSHFSEKQVPGLRVKRGPLREREPGRLVRADRGSWAVEQASVHQQPRPEGHLSAAPGLCAAPCPSRPSVLWVLSV